MVNEIRQWEMVLHGGQEHFLENVKKHNIVVLTLSQPLQLNYRIADVSLPEQDLSKDEAISPKVTYYFE